MKKLVFLTLSIVSLSCCSGNTGSSGHSEIPADFYAHRGGRAENDENTLQAFKQCISAGCDRFETDVRMTADGMIVISHDGNLLRRTGFDGRIEEMNGHEIISKKTFMGNNIPSLEQVLKLFRKKKVSYVEWELKTGNREWYPDERIPVYCETVYKAISKAKPEGADWVFISFDERPLKYLKGHHPDVTIGFLTSKPVCEETIAKALELGAAQIDANVEGTSAEAVKAAHDAGLEVCLWPGVSFENYIEIKALGADRYCTDCPNLLTAKLRNISQ